MADPETRAEIVAKLRDECPIRAIYVSRRKEVNCVNMGHSGTCDTCTYSWAVIAEDVIDLMGRRVAAVKRERTRVRELRQELSSLCYSVKGFAQLLDNAAANSETMLLSQKERAKLDQERENDGPKGSTEVQTSSDEGDDRGQRNGVDG